MSLRHPLFHRTILALLLDVQESGYEPPTLENTDSLITPLCNKSGVNSYEVSSDINCKVLLLYGCISSGGLLMF